MTEHAANEREPGTGSPRCPACGAGAAPGDRYCAECGMLLPEPRAGEPDPSPATGPVATTSAGFSAPATPGASSRESLWLLGAKPASVIGGGFLLLLAAVVLLLAGQFEATGTIVMLSICLTPLALITLAIGLARAIGAKMGR